MPFDNLNMPLARAFVAPHRPSPPTVVAADAVTHVLIAARVILNDENAWCGHGPGDERITFCAAMAVRRAAGCSMSGGFGYEPASSALWSAAMNDLDAQLGNRFSVAEYNDAFTTTHADVLALFDRAIASRLSKAEA